MHNEEYKWFLHTILTLKSSSGRSVDFTKTGGMRKVITREKALWASFLRSIPLSPSFRKTDTCDPEEKSTKGRRKRRSGKSRPEEETLSPLSLSLLAASLPVAVVCVWLLFSPLSFRLRQRRRRSWKFFLLLPSSLSLSLSLFTSQSTGEALTEPPPPPPRPLVEAAAERRGRRRRRRRRGGGGGLTVAWMEERGKGEPGRKREKKGEDGEKKSGGGNLLAQPPQPPPAFTATFTCYVVAKGLFRRVYTMGARGTIEIYVRSIVQRRNPLISSSIYAAFGFFKCAAPCSPFLPPPLSLCVRKRTLIRALPLEIEWIDAEGEEEAEKLLFYPGSILLLPEKEMLFFLWERKRDERGSFFLIKGLAPSLGLWGPPNAWWQTCLNCTCMHIKVI